MPEFSLFSDHAGLHTTLHTCTCISIAYIRVLLDHQSSYTLSSGDELKDRKEVIPDENVEIDTLTMPDGSKQVIVTDFNRVF